MTECVLVTGSGGTIGGDVLRLLHTHRRPGDRLVALVHTRCPTLRVPFHPFDRDAAEPGVEIVQGDISRPYLGLSQHEAADLQKRVTAVLHCAATTRFSATSEEAWRTNVEGTRTLLTFARGAPRLHRFGHVSTAFVAGKRTGPIRESELEHRAGFVNAYESSKYEAERLVRSSGLPWAIYRPSALVGSAETGAVRTFNGIHRAVSALLSGSAPALLGLPATPLDFVPDEFAAAAIHHLFSDLTPGQTFHLCSGRERALSLQDAVRAIEDVGARDLSHRETGPIPIVDAGSFALLTRSARRDGKLRTARALEAMGRFTPQLLYAKEFDCSTAAGGLAGTGIVPPPLGMYWHKIVEACAQRVTRCSEAPPTRSGEGSSVESQTGAPGANRDQGDLRQDHQWGSSCA
jgi:long-chain acyl-CoA synthetase